MELIKKILSKFIKPKYGWHGDYKSWEEALSRSLGYDQRDILNKVEYSATKVKQGLASYEQDSVLFYEPSYDWHILYFIYYCLSHKNGKTQIIDYGGSLGSTYYKNKKLLKNIGNLSWHVIEQTNFVSSGKEHFQDGVLFFHNKIDEINIDKNNSNILLLNCVLPYVNNPYQLLEGLLKYNFDIIILDRTPVSTTKGRLTIQTVPASIYKASYPSWIFKESLLLSFFTDYKMISCEDNRIHCNLRNVIYKRYIFINEYKKAVSEV